MKTTTEDQIKEISNLVCQLIKRSEHITSEPDVIDVEVNICWERGREELFTQDGFSVRLMIDNFLSDNDYVSFDDYLGKHSNLKELSFSHWIESAKDCICDYNYIKGESLEECLDLLIEALIKMNNSVVDRAGSLFYFDYNLLIELEKNRQTY